MTPTVESAVKDYLRRRAFCERHRRQNPLRGTLHLDLARSALADSLGMESITCEQADLIADTYFAEIDPPNRRRVRAVAQ